MVQTRSVAARGGSQDEAEVLDPSTKFLYSPHTLTVLLAGEGPGKSCLCNQRRSAGNAPRLITCHKTNPWPFDSPCSHCWPDRMGQALQSP